MGVQRRGRPRRWTSVPEVVDQAAGGHDMVGVHQQIGQQRAFTGGSREPFPAVSGDSDSPKDQKHMSPRPPCSWSRQCSTETGGRRTSAPLQHSFSRTPHGCGVLLTTRHHQQRRSVAPHRRATAAANLARLFVATACALTLGVATAPATQTHADPSGPAVDRRGIGGAGAFIPPAHVNGPFGAGGPLVGIGGAGAFIPLAHVNGPFGAGGPLVGIGGAGVFIPIKPS